jgi:hypothetical protein
MKRCERLPSRWDARGVWAHRWHALFCAECRRSRRADRTLARGARAFQRTRRQAPLPADLEAEILERLGLAASAGAAPQTATRGEGVGESASVTAAWSQATEVAGYHGAKPASAGSESSRRRPTSCRSSCDFSRLVFTMRAAPPRLTSGAAAMALLGVAVFGITFALHGLLQDRDHDTPLRAAALPRRAPLVPPHAEPRGRSGSGRAAMPRARLADAGRLRQPAMARRTVVIGASGPVSPSPRLPSASCAAGDDIARLNGDPVQDALAWAVLPADEGGALEAQVRRAVRVRDDFVRIPFPRLASASDRQIAAAVESYKREAAVVDARLFQKVGLQQKAVSLEELCRELARQSGIRIEASRGVADEKVTAFVKERSLREVMRQVTRLFGYTWLRVGKGGEYRYELIQDLRSQLMEEELRNRDLNEAFLAMDREMQALRPYLGLTPEQLRAKAEAAPTPEQKKRLRDLVGAGWGGLQMYFRLSPEEMAALRTGQRLAFSSQPEPKEQPLPSELRLPILGTLSAYRFWRQGKSAGVGPAGSVPPGAEQYELKALPEAQATTILLAGRSELGQIALEARSGFSVKSDNGSFAYDLDTVLARGVSPSVASPENAWANAALARDPALQAVVNWRPTSSCRCGGAYPGFNSGDRDARASEGGDTEAARGREPVTTADVLAAIHRATGIDLLSDAYTRLYPPASVSVEKRRLFDALNQVADAMHYRWRKEAGLLLFRSASYFNDKRKEVPNRLLERWAASLREHGHLTLDDLLEIAQLGDVQLDSQIAAEGVVRCYGLRGWGLATDLNLRKHLRFLATLDPEQRRLAQSPADLPFRRLNLGQQQQFLAVAFGGSDDPVAPEALPAARLRVDLSMPGQFEWVRETGGARKEFPIERRIRAATREQALAAARQRDPTARASEIQPTQADLHVEYALGPGSDGWRQTYIIDRGVWYRIREPAGASLPAREAGGGAAGGVLYPLRRPAGAPGIQ